MFLVNGKKKRLNSRLHYFQLSLIRIPDRTYFLLRLEAGDVGTN